MPTVPHTVSCGMPVCNDLLGTLGPLSFAAQSNIACFRCGVAGGKGLPSAPTAPRSCLLCYSGALLQAEGEHVTMPSQTHYSEGGGLHAEVPCRTRSL